MLSTLCHAGEREEFEAYKQQIKTEQKKDKEEFRVYSKKLNS